MTKIRKVCCDCGGDDVLADAYASWSEERQEWDVANIFDRGAFCNTCEGETRIEDEEISE